MSPEGLVARARDAAGRRVLLRVSRAGGARAQGAAELSLLAAVRDPSLAAFLEGGLLDDGRHFVAREWIEGRELGAWAVDRSLRERGAAIARVAAALERLHRLGYVHGDLKPQNVIVEASDEVRLCDFGLTRPGPSADAPWAGTEPVSGSAFFVAPELLCGAPLEARADLFALGVLAHELFVGRRPAAREFYGRFPQRPFLEAVGASPEDLPEWSRDLVAELTRRDPAGRPASAGQVACTLAQRLGLACEEPQRRATLRLSPTFGRGAWLQQWIASLAEDERTPQWIRLCEGEDPEALVGELRRVVALHGHSSEGVVWERLARDVGSLGELDRRCAESILSCERELYLVACTEDSAWARRTLVHAAHRSRRAGHGARLVVVAAFDPPEPAFAVRALGPLSEEALGAFLAAGLDEPDGERRAALARALLGATGGSATGIDALLREGAERGWLLVDGERPRLRGAPPTAALLSEGGRALVGLGADAAALALALEVTGAVGVEDACATSALGAERFAAALAELLRPGRVRTFERGGERVLELAPGVHGADADRAARAAAHGRFAARLEARGAERSLVLAHRWAASTDAPGAFGAEDGQTADPDTRALLELCAELRGRGLAERALDLVDHLERLHARRGGELCVDFPALVAERADAWCELGQLEHALRWAGVLEQADADASIGEGGARWRARAELVRARVESLRHRPEQALAHVERASRLAPACAPLVRAARLELAHLAGRDEEVLALAAELATGPPEDGRLELPGLPERRRSYVESLVAVSRLRRGQVGQARASLRRLVEEARRVGDELREGALRLSLATVERRATRERRAAREELERARRLFDRAGHLAGAAHVRSSLAGLLREAGELQDAEPLLLSAREIRERLNDPQGASLVQGMLGLLALERGYVRRAIEELRAALAGLSGANAGRHGPLLGARLCEARARIGQRDEGLEELLARQSAAPGTDGPRTHGREGVAWAGDADPRVGASLARSLFLLDEPERARGLALVVRARAVRLGQGAVQRDLDNLLWGLALHGVVSSPGSPGSRDPHQPVPGTGSGRPGETENGLLGAHEPPTSLEEQDALILALFASPGAFPTEEAVALVERVTDAGRDDRAARVWLALAARESDARRARAARDKAEAALERVSMGLSDGEAAALRRTLLGFPDAWPEDLTPERKEDWDGVPTHELVSLLEVTRRLLDREDLPSLLGTIVDQAIAISRAERGFLVLEEEGELRFDTATHSLRGEIDAPGLEISYSVVRRALETMAPLRASNAVDDPLLGGSVSVSALELRSILCLPFGVDEGVRGALYLDHRLRTGAFDLTAERLCGLLAGQAGLAIREAMRREEIRVLNARLQDRLVTTEKDLRAARRALGRRQAGVCIVGRSGAMQRVQEMIDRAAGTDIAVLVLGPSGSGKELVARALHERSPRSEAPFVAESCAAIPASLIEAELFGHAKGAFTGAHRDRAGLFERANGGTLFLDEIGEMPLEIQARLLRVLETGEFRRVGDSRTRRASVRLVAATNRVLTDEVREGRFRADLFYRLDGWRIDLPPLSERVEDIPELVEHFLGLEERKDGVSRRVSPAVMARLCERAWPGNVRELSNELARLCALSDGDLEAPELVRQAERGAPGEVKVLTLAEMERRLIMEAIESVGGDKQRAARLLGISRSKIYQRLRQWGGDAMQPSEPRST